MANKIDRFEDARKQKAAFKNMIRSHFVDFDPDSKEVNGLWDSAIRIVAAERGPKWTTLDPAVRTAIKEVAVLEDLEKWPFNITKAVHVGDMIQITVQHLDQERQITMKALDWQSQPKFRSAFFQATSTTIPAIKGKSFETFASSIIFERNEGYGTSITEDVQEVLQSKLATLREKELLEEHVEELRRRGWSRQQGTVSFRLNALMQEQLMKCWNKSNVVLALEQLGLGQEDVPNIGKVWSWSIPKA
jgi:hypothetical protein